MNVKDIAVLVPRKSDGGHRDRVWAWNRQRWNGWRLYEGHHDNGPFNRSAAINDAAAQAGDWDIGIITDSDSFVGFDQLHQAVDGCRTDGRMWLPYDRFCYLSHAMTDRVMDGYTGIWEPGVEFTMTGTCSSVVVVRRDVWDRCGGFDEGFKSWGMEDVAFSHAAQTFGGGLARVAGPTWHLWHPPSVERNAHRWDAKVARAERYHAAAYDEPAMTALLLELGVTHDPSPARANSP